MNSLEQIRERMGPDSTLDEAEKLLELLQDRGVESDQLTDDQWFDLVCEVVR
jgi:hypothetical protein